MKKTHIDRASENRNHDAPDVFPIEKDKRKSTFQIMDGKPEAIAQRELQAMADKSPQSKLLRSLQTGASNQNVKQLRTGGAARSFGPITPQTNGEQRIRNATEAVIQRMTDEELKERGGKIRAANALRVPEAGVNLWRMENQNEDAAIYLIGTAHALKLSEMGANEVARQYLIRFLQTENFSHVYTEVEANLPRAQFDKDLASKLETKIQAEQALISEFPNRKPKDSGERISFLKKENAVNNADALLGGVDAADLDDAYAFIASTRDKDVARPEVGVLENDDARKAAYDANVDDMQINEGDPEHRLRRAEREHISSNDSVINGNQQDLFVEASEEMLAGRDLASSEQRNKQWMDRVKDMQLVKNGDRQLWIIGAAHLPGLILRFSELGWNPHHMAPPAVKKGV